MSNNIRQRVTDLEMTIMSAENELLRLRSECTHPTYRTEMYMWRVGSMIPARICDVCDASIPGITEEESNAVWTRYSQNHSTGTFYYNLPSEAAEEVQNISTTSGGTQSSG